MTSELHHSPATSLNAVCAVVVSYHPETTVLLDLLNQLDQSGCDFILIDNHSNNIDHFKTKALGFNRCREVICLPENLGQASALNEALTRIETAGYELALLFDQDSSIDDNFVPGMLTSWNLGQQIARGTVAAIGPRLIEPRSKRRMPFRTFRSLIERSETVAEPQSRLIDTAFLITSGCLLAVGLLPRIGLMRSDYFIDNVDLEWCFRAKALGYQLFGTELATLHHRIGEDSDNVLVRRGVIVQHSALRYYYSSRNRIHLHKQPYTPWIWRTKDIVRFVLKSTYLLITSGDRHSIWTNLRRAVRDARHLS